MPFAYTINKTEIRRTTVELTALSPTQEGLTAFIPTSQAHDYPVGSEVWLALAPDHQPPIPPPGVCAR